MKDINLVHSAITFSCYFTVSDLEARWQNLLFTSKISKASQREISLLPHDIRQRMIDESALFSDEENQFLINVSRPLKLGCSVFEQLLGVNFLIWKTVVGHIYQKRNLPILQKIEIIDHFPSNRPHIRCKNWFGMSGQEDKFRVVF